jgi:hypothetical protein
LLLNVKSISTNIDGLLCNTGYASVRKAPSSGEAVIISLQRHPNSPACDSGAAFDDPEKIDYELKQAWKII